MFQTTDYPRGSGDCSQQLSSNITQAQTSPCPLHFSTLAQRQVGWIHSGSMAQFGNFRNYFHRPRSLEIINLLSHMPNCSTTPARIPARMEKRMRPFPKNILTFIKANLPLKKFAICFLLNKRESLGYTPLAHVLGVGFGWVAWAVLQAKAL